MSEKYETEEELIDIPNLQTLVYNYAAGRFASRFFHELKENKKVMGIKCSECGKVYLPPRPICADCYDEMNEWVELSGKGMILGFTSVNFPIFDPLTGESRPVPYGVAIVSLDGCNTDFVHFLEESDPGKVKVGMKVQTILREERKGSLDDIQYFRIIEE